MDGLELSGLVVSVDGFMGDCVLGATFAEEREFVLSLSFPSFSLGNGGNATARRCFLLPLPKLPALAVVFTSDALLGALPDLLFSLMSDPLFDLPPSSVSASLLPNPAKLLTSAGNTGVLGADEGESILSGSYAFLNVLRKNPGRPRGCGVLSGCEDIVIIFREST